MTRHKRESEGEKMFNELVDIASEIPWWFTLPVAALLFTFVPDVYTEPSSFEGSSAMASALVAMFFKGVFKYIVPFAFVIGAVINIYHLFKSDSLFKSIKKKGARETLDALSWQDFEFLLSEWFKKQGFSTELTGGGGADGGIDIKLLKDGELYLVQCKHYKAWKVPVTVVREHFGIVTAENAAGGYIVTSGKFTADAISFAQGKNIKLVDGDKLEEILATVETVELKSKETASSTCPKCGSAMVERKGKYGTFLGCSTYPKCKHTQQIT